MIVCKRAALCIFLLASDLAAAGSQQSAVTELQKDLLRCESIRDSNARLTCYDELANRVREPASERSKEEFGLSAAKRAPLDEVNTINEKIVALGRSRNGKPTLELSNGQVWELDGSDPLLDAGQAITIKRAAMSSFLLVTQQKRTYRARRLR